MSNGSAFRTTLQLREVSKRFSAGAGSCTAEVNALRAVSLELRGGEVLVVAGPPSSGKSTLLLCAAGLLCCDSGDITGASCRVVYRDLQHPARPIERRVLGSVLILDSCDTVGALARARAIRVISDAIYAGAAVVLAARDAEACIALTPVSATISIVHLRLGEISARHGVGVPAHRVAEAAGGGY